MLKNLKFPLKTKRKWLWPIPIRPGLYGGEIGSNLYVTTNDWNEVYSLGKERGNRLAVLVLDAGGCDVKTAAAFNFVNREQFIACLNNLKVQDVKEGVVSIPKVLADSLGLSEGLLLDYWNVQIIGTSYSFVNKAIVRLLYGIRLGTCQALLFAIPLSILGLWELFAGISMVYSSVIILSLVWQILPGSGFFKGLICGSFLVVGNALFITRSGFGIQFWLVSVACLIVSVWLGWMLEGVGSDF